MCIFKIAFCICRRPTWLSDETCDRKYAFQHEWHFFNYFPLGSHTQDGHNISCEACKAKQTSDQYPTMVPGMDDESKCIKHLANTCGCKGQEKLKSSEADDLKEEGYKLYATAVRRSGEACAKHDETDQNPIKQENTLMTILKGLRASAL